MPKKRPTPQERNTFSTEEVPEKAILVSVCSSGTTMERTQECLNELAFLLDTAGGIPVKQVIQKLERPDTRTYVGSGKLEEILKPAPMAIEDLLDEIIKLGKDVIFVGDGIPAFKSAIQDTLESGYYFGRQNFARQNAGSLASLGIDALKEGKAVISDLFAPEYMRLSQAERERLNNGKKDENK